MTTGEVNRREFLKGTATVATVAAASPVLTTVPAAAAGANDRIRFAVIGCGGQGRRSHIGRFPKGVNTEIAYVCATRTKSGEIRPPPRPAAPNRWTTCAGFSTTPPSTR